MTDAAAANAPDWYDANLFTLLTVFAASVSTFLVLTLVLFACLRVEFSAASAATTTMATSSARTSIDSLELTLVKSHTRAARLLSLVGILLQIALVLELTSDDNASSDADTSGERAPFLFSLARPVANSCAFFVGFMTNTHGAFRVLLLLLLSAVVAGDTAAEVQVAMMLACQHSQGLRCGSSGYLFTDVARLQRLLLRDLASLFIGPWLLLEGGYLCVAVGVCGSRFSRRQLSISRPRLNIRAALALHFPELFDDLAESSSEKWRPGRGGGGDQVRAQVTPTDKSL